MDSLRVESLFGVKDKVVLVTGGSRGIGKMIATGFVKNGAKVYISSRSAQDCAETAKELCALGPGECVAIPADMQKLSEVERLAEELAAKESKLHVLVNNAGATWADSIDDYPDGGFSKVINLNLQRVFTLTQKVLPLLRAGAEAGGKINDVYADPTRIINIGSVEGLMVPNHDTYAYSASKAALHHLSRHMAGRLGSEGIHSNVIACGAFQSKMTAGLFEQVGEVIMSHIPSGRYGTPEDVAGTALYLSSRAAAYVNGATLALDGGWLVHMPTASKL